MSAGVLERTDVDELIREILDDGGSAGDPTVHAHCLVCYPNRGRVIGLCGRPKVCNNNTPDPSDTFPPNACPKCLELYDQPCARCGS